MQASCQVMGAAISREPVVARQPAESAPRPRRFVDDYLPYFRGVPESVHAALVHRARNGSPNEGPELSIVSSVHDDLGGFVDYWLAR